MDPCKCEYWCNESGSCDYEWITGCKLPCEPGKNCDFNPERGPISNKPRSKTGGKKATWDTKKGMELYKAGATDTEIAEAVGISRATIANWRFRNKLPENTKLIVSEAASAEEVSTPYVYTGDMPAENFIALQEQVESGRPAPAAMTAGALCTVLGDIDADALIHTADGAAYITGCYVRTVYGATGSLTETEVILFSE